jgi:molybdopterin synthase sulfur carrier subunit
VTGVVVLYFASLRDAAGVESERVNSDATDLAGLYAQLQVTHGFMFPLRQLRVAVDGAFVDWQAPLRENSTVAFIPPVSGG